MSLTDKLHRTSTMLAAGESITSIAHKRKDRIMGFPDATTTLLDRITTAHGIVDSYEFACEPDETGAETMRQIVDNESHATELYGMLLGLASLLADAGREIARLDSECAGLRAREGK